MKALSLTRPWATLAVLGEKVWETRSGRYHHYGLTAIHSSDGFPRPLVKLYPGGLEMVIGLPFFREALARYGITSSAQLPVKAIIGVVDIIRYARTHVARRNLSEQELAFGLYTDGRWAYQLANPQPIKPIACRGAQGLWTVPPEIAQEVRAQIAGRQPFERAPRLFAEA